MPDRNIEPPYWLSKMQNLARNWGLMNGHTNYQKFIILGRSRSGSNFLRGLMNSHSQIQVFGEIFQNKDQIGWAMDGYPQDLRTLQEFRDHVVDFLDQRVFHKFPRRFRAVGFKIFYYHARDETWSPVWEYLKAQEGLKIIHIQRRNILETHLSRQRAVLTDQWFNLTGVKEKPRPVTLKYEECLQDFIQTRQWEIETARYFDRHPILNVFYEELADDHERVMAGVQDFLGVRREALNPETFKQSDQPLSVAIENYAELKERFQGTPWAEFFSE